MYKLVNFKRTMLILFCIYFQEGMHQNTDEWLKYIHTIATRIHEKLLSIVYDLIT